MNNSLVLCDSSTLTFQLNDTDLCHSIERYDKQ